jgi:hypothetical protein
MRERYIAIGYVMLTILCGIASLSLYMRLHEDGTTIQIVGISLGK